MAVHSPWLDRTAMAWIQRGWRSDPTTTHSPWLVRNRESSETERESFVMTLHLSDPNSDLNFWDDPFDYNKPFL